MSCVNSFFSFFDREVELVGLGSVIRIYPQTYISWSEQAPGSLFHPCNESGIIDCDFLGPFWCNIKVDPERKVPCGLYKLLVGYVAHQMKEKIRFQKLFLSFLSEIFIDI